MLAEDPNELFLSTSEILPGFYIGNQRASTDVKFLSKIDVIVNCTKHIKFTKLTGKKHIYIRIPVNDPGNSDHLSIDDLSDNDDQVIMLKYMPIVIELIAHYRKQGKRVLVHCHAGMQRSCIIAAAYIICYGQWAAPTLTDRQFRIAKTERVIRLLVNKRPVAFNGGLSVNFRPALLRFMKLN